MHADCFNAAGATLTSGFSGVGEEALRSVAAVVVRRAQAAAWRLLQEKLLATAGCGAVDTRRFPATCATLRSLSIADLASSPTVLLDAVIADFLPLAHPPEASPWMHVPLLEEAVREAAIRWRQSGADGLRSGFAQIVRRRMREQAGKADCELATSAADKALWVSGMCLIEVQAPASFGGCDVNGWASQCTDPITTARILQIWSLVSKVIAAPGKAPLSDYVDLVCTSADIAIDEAPDLSEARRGEAHEHVAALRAVFGGLAHADWIETTSGAVRALRRVVASAACRGKVPVPACEDARAAQELFTLLAAVGNYAQSFRSSPGEGGAAREKILEDLADRMVSRGRRDSGWLVSAGGNVGVLGGARFGAGGAVEVAFPVQLGLGIGLQSYGSGDHGFHAMASFFDLGQYVSFSSGSLAVAAPSLESSVVLGLTAGGWLGLRETPLYLGAYGGISPFVKANGRPTFQAGLTAGIYVPLFDF
jgi:hypothetical protein